MTNLYFYGRHKKLIDQYVTECPVLKWQWIFSPFRRFIFPLSAQIPLPYLTMSGTAIVLLHGSDTGLPPPRVHWFACGSLMFFILDFYIVCLFVCLRFLRVLCLAVSQIVRS